MRTVVPLLLVGLTAVAAEDPWAKVRELRSGVELRIFKVGVKQPVLAKMDELREESLLVVVKNAQVAIPKDEIERIDFRSAQKGSRVKTETKTTAEPTDQKPWVLPQVPKTPPGSRSSTSTGVSITTGPGFETVYRKQK